MAWEIELTPEAQRNLSKLDPQIHRRILQFLNERLAKLEDPRSIGEALKGSQLGDSWKYRVGDFRVIAGIADAKVTIFIVRVGHRREIYR